MSIYIKGMEMPKSCVECLRIGWQYVFECNLDDVEDGKRLITCPLIEVSPHGDLVERKSVLNTFSTHMNRTLHFVTIRDTVPTIIPADKEES